MLIFKMKKMKKLYIKISMIIISLTAFTSCSDDFVNVDSNDVNSEDFLIQKKIIKMH